MRRIYLEMVLVEEGRKLFINYHWERLASNLEVQRRIWNPVKHLSWCFLGKTTYQLQKQSSRDVFVGKSVLNI